MGTSRALVAPGLRTAPVASGWRADASNIASTIRLHPGLVVPGTIGFALRGGIVLLTVPILILPTSVEARLLLGSNIGSTGLTSGFYVLLAVLTALTLVVAVGVLYLIARCEVALFSRFVNSHEPSAEHAWLPPGRLAPAAMRSVARRLFIVEALALLAVVLCALPLAFAIGQATINEIQLPSSTDSMYVRIATDVAVPFIAWLVAIVVVEALSAIAARRVLARAYGISAHARIARHPLRALGVALVGWALFIGALTVSIAVLIVAWGVVRSVYLSTGLSGDLRDIASALVVAMLFGVFFAAALLLSGLVSAIRAGLWTLASLR